MPSKIGSPGTDMARMGAVANRAEALLGATVVATTPVAGGDICTSTRLRLSDGTSVLVKTRPHAPSDFFHSEAQGLRWLASAGGAQVPDVLAVEEDCLILEWVEEGRPTADSAEQLGRALAATHQAGSPVYGTGSEEDGYIGTLPLPNRSAPTWPEFFATRRILPYLKLARDRSAITAEDATAVEGAVRKLTELAGPAEPPSRLHGDLWSGNVLWASQGAAWLVDPAAYGGHRETDLAMLALFGLPHLQRVLDSYHEAFPLADGWEERVALHQLFPLLVHACLFGGGYGRRAGEAARTLL
jgi:fructosamine-3-kinase